MIERRHMERFPLELRAEIKSIGEGNKKYSQEQVTTNICAGGAYFAMETTLPVDTDVRVSFYWPPERFLTGLAPHKNMIKLTGYVVRAELKGIAIRFNRNFKFTAVH